MHVGVANTRCGGGENVSGIPGACATRNFAYLARGSWSDHILTVAIGVMLGISSYVKLRNVLASPCPCYFLREPKSSYASILEHNRVSEQKWEFQEVVTVVYISLVYPPSHNDIIVWKYFHVTGPLWGESTGHRWGPVTRSFHIYAWTNGWANNRDVADLRRHYAHYDVTVMTYY